jgi:hypothetical protein
VQVQSRVDFGDRGMDVSAVDNDVTRFGEDGSGPAGGVRIADHLQRQTQWQGSSPKIFLP